MGRRGLLAWLHCNCCNEKLAALTGITVENIYILERITDKNGNYRFIMTDKQARQGRNVGKSLYLNCYICHKHLTPMGDAEYVQATLRCIDCKMPLCKND
jgi:hypothetical protein